MSSDSKKIPDYLEGKIDILILELVKIINPIFKRFNLSPNHITTLSLVFGLISVYRLKNKQYFYSALYYLVSYFFDCQDGNYARTYNMVTDYGDIYDHLKDFIVFILIGYYLIKNVKYKYLRIIYIIILSLMIIGLNLYSGCVEKYMKNNTDYKNSFISKITICSSKPKNELKYLKYICSGNVTILLCILIISLYFH